MEILSHRRQCLSIEARHTISLEVAKQRRLKVASSIFLPSKPMRQIIPISIDQEIQSLNKKKKTKKPKKELIRLNPVEGTRIETKETEKKRKRPRKRVLSASKELIPSKQILILTGEVEINNLALPKQTPKETPTISSQPAKGEKDKSPFCEEVVSTTIKEEDITHRLGKKESSPEKYIISEVSKARTKSTCWKAYEERTSSSYKPVLSQSSETQKARDDTSSSIKDISSSYLRKTEIEWKKLTTHSEKGEAVISKEIVAASRKENGSGCWGKRHKHKHTDKKGSSDKYSLSKTSILSERVSSSEYQTETLPATATAGKVESEILPTTTTTDKTAKKTEAEILPATTTAEKFEAGNLPATATAVKVEAEILPATATAEKVEAEILPATATAVKVEAEILPATTTTDITAEKVEAEILPATTTAEKFEAGNLTATATAEKVEAVKVEAEILPATTTTDKTAEKVEAEILPATATAEKVKAEILPATTTTDKTAEKVEAEILPTATTTDKTAEKVKAEILPTATTTDRIADKVEILSDTIIYDIKKRSPRKQILFRTRIAELESSDLFTKGSQQTLSRVRKTDDQMETVGGSEEITISDKETPVIFAPKSATAENSSTNAKSGVCILTSDPNGSKQFQETTKTTPQYRNLVQYWQGHQERPQATPMQLPTNTIQSATAQGNIYNYEGPGLPHTKNTFVQKSSASHRKYAPEEHTVRHRSRTDASDKVEYIAHSYNDKPMNCGIRLPQSYSNSYGLNDMRFLPYDPSQRRPREHIQPSQFSPELPAAPYHNQPQLNQGPVPAYPANLQPNFIADWVSSMNAQNQIALANTVIKEAQEMPSTSYPRNLPQWLQHSINNLNVNAPAPIVHHTSYQTPSFREHPTQANMGRWTQPSITQAPFEPMNQHPPMQRWPNNRPTYQKYSSPFNNPNLMQHEPEMPAAMGYPNINQGCVLCCPVQMNSPSGNRGRSMLGAPNMQPPIRHEEAPRARPPYSAPSIYQADSTTGGNSPPLPIWKDLS